MSAGTRELARRRAALQLRVAMQRQLFASEVRIIEQRLQSVDRVAGAARRALANPLVIVAALVGAYVVGPARVVSGIGRVLFIAAALRRLWDIVRR